MTEVEVEGGECRAVNFFITIAPRRDENSLHSALPCIETHSLASIGARSSPLEAVQAQ
jgi:hypothetical protein